MMYGLIVEGRPAVWLLVKSAAKEGVVVQEHNYRVREGDTENVVCWSRQQSSTAILRVGHSVGLNTRHGDRGETKQD